MALALALAAGTSFAQEPAPAKSPLPADPGDSVEAIAAVVDGRPIFLEDVRVHAERIIRGRPVTAEARTRLLRESLQLLVQQRIVLDFLQQQELAMTAADLDLLQHREQRLLQAREHTWDDYLKKLGLSERQWRDQQLWRGSWGKYVESYSTDENLQRFFTQHKRDYDGSRLKVAHVLLKADPQDPAAMADARRRALEIRQQILDKNVSFAEAARRYSESPSAQQGGALGWIQRHEPMPPSFSDAAFALQQDGQISEPVATAYGMHLIELQEHQPGDKTWQEVQPELRAAVAQYLFQWLATNEATKHQVEINSR